MASRSPAVSLGVLPLFFSHTVSCTLEAVEARPVRGKASATSRVAVHPSACCSGSEESVPHTVDGPPTRRSSGEATTWASCSPSHPPPSRQKHANSNATAARHGSGRIRRLDPLATRPPSTSSPTARSSHDTVAPGPSRPSPASRMPSQKPPAQSASIQPPTPSDRDFRAEISQSLVADPGDVQQVVDGSKWAVQLAVVDDSLTQRGTDARERLQLVQGGGVEVDEPTPGPATRAGRGAAGGPCRSRSS